MLSILSAIGLFAGARYDVLARGQPMLLAALFYGNAVVERTHRFPTCIMGCDFAISATVRRVLSVFLPRVFETNMTSHKRVGTSFFRSLHYGLRLRYQLYRAARFKRTSALVFWRVKYPV